MQISDTDFHVLVRMLKCLREIKDILIIPANIDEPSAYDYANLDSYVIKKAEEMDEWLKGIARLLDVEI